MLTYPGAQQYADWVFDTLKKDYAVPECWVVSDEPPGDFGIAHAYGLNPDGCALITFDSDRIPLRYTITHEIGHALSANIDKMRGKNGWESGKYDEFWAARGFPGTAWDAQLEAIARENVAVNSGYRYWPEESFADTFGVVNTPYAWPITEQRGVWLDQPKMIEFYKALGDDMFTEADRALLSRVRDLLEAREALVWQAREQRTLDVETGKPFNPNTAPLDPRIKQ